MNKLNLSICLLGLFYGGDLLARCYDGNGFMAYKCVTGTTNADGAPVSQTVCYDQFYPGCPEEYSFSLHQVVFGNRPVRETFSDSEPPEWYKNSPNGKVPYAPETVADLITLALQVKNAVNKAMLIQGLSGDALAFLTKLANQADKVLGRVNAGTQVSNHLINNELGLAGSEFISLIAGLGTGHLTGLGLVSLGSVIGGTTGAVLVFGAPVAATIVGFAVAHYAEEYLDVYLPLILTSMEDAYNIVIYEVENSFPDDPYQNMCSGTGVPGYYCQIPPIIISKKGSKLEFSDPKDNAIFDVNNDGKLDGIALPLKGNKLVFIDENNNGLLDDIREIVFSRFAKLKGATDLDGLKSFDTNNDGVIDYADEMYYTLYIWEDLNNNSKIESNESFSFHHKDIRLSLNYNRSFYSVKNAVVAAESKAVIGKKSYNVFDVYIDAYIHK